MAKGKGNTGVQGFSGRTIGRMLSKAPAVSMGTGSKTAKKPTPKKK